MKKNWKIPVLFLAIFVIAMLADGMSGTIKADNVIVRGDLGEKEQEVNLRFYLDGTEGAYDYKLEIPARLATRDEATGYFQKAIQQMEKDFLVVGTVVPMKEKYCDGIVNCEWEFEPWGYIGTDGTIRWDKLTEEQLLVTATAKMQCGLYQQTHQFAFELHKPIKTKEETVLQALDLWVQQEGRQEGQQDFHLPKEADGSELLWKEKRDSITLKVLLLEAVAVVALWYGKRKSEQEHRKRLRLQREKDYPEVVSQLTLLIGAGMTIRQSWNRIATRYGEIGRKAKQVKSSVYEEISFMNRRLCEGESERDAYRKFEETMATPCYHKLVQLLLNRAEKGTGGICEALEQECDMAYEQRILRAKKMGEEASTRMLVPLMLMMVVVMAIVMIPALIGFAA